MAQQDKELSTSAESVLARLVQRDRRFTNYKLEFSVRLSIKSEGIDPELLKLSRAANTDHLRGSHWEDHEAKSKSQTVNGGWSYEGRLGQDSVSYSNDANEPLISPGLVVFKKPDSVPVSVNFSVVAGLHPVLALGFGSLSNAKTSKSGPGMIVTGELPGRGRVEIEYEVWPAEIPTRVTIGTSESSQMRFDYEAVVVSDGIAYPSLVKFRQIQAGEEVSRAEYRIEKLEFGGARLAERKTWFLPGYIFMDERLEVPVEYDYALLLQMNQGSTELTAERLLEFSKLRLPLAIAEKRASEARPETGGRSAGLYIAGIGVLVGVAAFVAWKRTVNKRNR